MKIKYTRNRNKVNVARKVASSFGRSTNYRGLIFRYFPQFPPFRDFLHESYGSYAHLSGTTTMSVSRLRTSRLQNEEYLYFYNFEEILWLQ